MPHPDPAPEPVDGPADTATDSAGDAGVGSGTPAAVEPARPVLDAIVRAAVDATGADGGWLLRAARDHFVVAAASNRERVGEQRAMTGVAGFVVASGQPAAIQSRPGDTDDVGAGGLPGAPRSLLAAPCGAGDVLGVLELVDAPGGSFSFDDVELAALLAEVAGAALGESATAAPPPHPARLADGLAALAASEPERYADVARAVETLL